MTFSRVAVLLAILMTPGLALAAAAPQTFQSLAYLLVTILNSATGVLIIAGIAIYFYGISTNILKFGEGDAERLKNYFFWGIIVLFLMVSLWGILALLRDTLLGSQLGSTGTTQSTVSQSSNSTLPTYANQ